MILHIVTREDYEKYLNSPNKEYRPARFAKDGFIHCSNESQVSGVANFMFKGRKDLVLFLIDEDRVRECLKYEDPGSGNLFPHVYRTFFENDIKKVYDFLPDTNGEFRLPEELNRSIKPTLYIFCGLPFSGKTTLAKEILRQTDLEFISIDDIKFAHGFNWTEDEKMTTEEWQKIFDESYEKALKALKAGKSVLYDSANQSRESRDKLREIAKQAEAETKVIFMNIPAEVVEERWKKNLKTKDRFHLPERFFRAAFSNYEPPTQDENILVFNEEDSASTWATVYFGSKRIRVAGIVIKDKKVLLIHRVNYGKEYYVFPGGKQEENEILEKTVVRELQEETTISVKPVKSIYHIVWDNGDENYFYLCEYISGTPKLSVDSEEYAEMKLGKQVYEPTWVDVDKLPELLVYQLEIRDLLIEDLKTGFSDKVKELKIKVSERREKI